MKVRSSPQGSERPRLGRWRMEMGICGAARDIGFVGGWEALRAVEKMRTVVEIQTEGE